jgi:Rrf2 family protein
MKLSTRTRYGLRALLDIAAHGGGAPVQLKEIARRQEVSLAYLEHIVGPLIAGGILRSTRGMFGGVSLLKEPREILLWDVVNLLEGSVAAVDCVPYPHICRRAETCATRRLWSELTEAMRGVLESRTLADLMRGDDGTADGSCAVAAVRPLADAARIVDRTRRPVEGSAA